VIQWFPGHMKKARQLIADAMPKQDVVIEVLDARMPRASENPIVTELRRHKPCIKVLSKSDLADPERTRAWVKFFEEEVHPSPGDGLPPGRVVALPLTTSRPAEARSKIPALVRQLAPNKKILNAIVVGVPNAGKSTLINMLANRKAAKVGDEPAVTRGRQTILLDGAIAVSDVPGMTWPKIVDEGTGLRLAFAGSIPDSAIDYETVALWGARYLLKHYASLVVARYKLPSAPETARELLEAIGKRRGGLRAGGVIDLHKAADALIHDFRSGALGRISLEEP
jgi:ribosome biogenesis GTPase A